LTQGVLEANRPAVLLQEIAKRLIAEFAEILAEILAQQFDGLQNNAIQDDALRRHS
jgi:hypothetical protein